MKPTCDKKIVFYDGECGLCQRSIFYLANLDIRRELFFAPLNGTTYQACFEQRSEMSSVVFYFNGQVFTKSDAFIEIGRCLGGWLRCLVLLKLIPRFIRDRSYDLIARYRKKVSCVILIKDQRFLE